MISKTHESPASAVPVSKGAQAVFAVLGALSVSHLLNDLIQSLVPATYPVLKVSFGLNFAQIGLITFIQSMTASILQPFVGFFTDRRPQPYSLVAGMTFTLIGLLCIAFAPSYGVLLCAVAIVGSGSSVFHPEASRMARAASGGQHGLAQAIFQVGGNLGAASGPLMAALVVAPEGQRSLAFFSVAAMIAIVILTKVGRWYKSHPLARPGAQQAARAAATSPVSRGRTIAAIGILLVLIFSKYFYMASLTSYFPLYLIHRFHLSVRVAQMHLFIFLGAVAVGTLIGGPLGDRIGRKLVIWGSILGILPFTLMLPAASLAATGVLTAFIGLILASAFSAILVYAQELLPARVGTVAGLFFGFAFGMGGIGAAILGRWADIAGLDVVYRACSYLPALGLLAAFLPDIEKKRPFVLRASG
ncbi:MAG: MFS transporter [Capsulimonadaceae bacterium]|nr:MFS transporter [Capsulimonadaceae bacterium]